LGDLIRLLGLSIDKVKTIHKGHGKEYVYKISDKNNLMLSSILTFRASKSFDTYQFEYWKRVHKANSYNQVVYKPVYLTNDFGSNIKVFANSKNPYDLAPLKSSKKAKNQGYS
jgi:mevalonate pyrophosphate decarboxylase